MYRSRKKDRRFGYCAKKSSVPPGVRLQDSLAANPSQKSVPKQPSEVKIRIKVKDQIL